MPVPKHVTDPGCMALEILLNLTYHIYHQVIQNINFMKNHFSTYVRTYVFPCIHFIINSAIIEGLHPSHAYAHLVGMFILWLTPLCSKITYSIINKSTLLSL